MHYGDISDPELLAAIQIQRASLVVITIDQAAMALRYQAALLASVNDAIVASDAQYRLTSWNPAAETMYGWGAEEVLGRDGLEIVRTEWPAAEAKEMRRTIAETGDWRGEASQQRKDGTRSLVAWKSSMVSGTPTARAMAIKCSTALVEPPSAIVTTIAFSNASRVMIARGRSSRLIA